MPRFPRGAVGMAADSAGASISAGLTNLRIEAGRPADELVKMTIDGFVAFAAAVLQTLDIEHMDAAPPIADQADLLQLAGDEGDAAALHTQHLREKLLRQRQGVAHQQIA